MSSYNHFGCSWCGGLFNGGNCPGCSSVGSGNEFVYDLNPYSYNETLNFFNQPLQPQYETNSCELCGNGSHYGFDYPPRVPLAANISTHTPKPSRHFNFTCDDDDDDEKYSIPLKDMPQISPSIALDEFIKSSVEDLIPIPRESEDTSGSDSENVLPSSDDLSPIFEEKSVTFSNPLFDSNYDFTSSDDESLSDEDVLKDVKIYLNPLFEFDDEYISSDVNSLFDEVLEDIECKVSYDSNLDESTFLVTPLSDSNEDEFFTPRDNVELLLHHDPSISIVSILEGFTDEPSFKENDDLFDLESKENDWKKNLYDAPIDDLITEDKVFDPGIHEKSFSSTFVKLTFEDRHYFSITFVIRIFLPYLTYSVDSSFLLSSRSEDTIFDPGISAFQNSSLKPVAYENPIVIFPFFCFCPKDKGIRGEIYQDHEDPCLFSILQSSGLQSSAYYGILNPDHVY
ncbi:hypothetical protein Tco_0611838 [Tanacetum coccineum]